MNRFLNKIRMRFISRPASKAEQAEEYKKDVKNTAFRFSIAALAAKLIQIDVPINSKEQKAFSKIFSDFQEVDILLKEALKDRAEFECYAERIMTFFPENKKLFRDVTGKLFQLAVADSHINTDEIIFLKKLSSKFELTEQFFIQKLRLYILPPSGGAYEVLSVSKKITYPELKKAYHQAMQLYHPDRLSFLDSAEEIIKLANHRINTINEAYRTIKKQKNF